MPSGHTTKQTMTQYRQRLLDRCPVHRTQLSNSERRQLNELCRFGLAHELRDGWFMLTNQTPSAPASAAVSQA